MLFAPFTGPMYRHYKGGIYRIFAIAEVNVPRSSEFKSEVTLGFARDAAEPDFSGRLFSGDGLIFLSTSVVPKGTVAVVYQNVGTLELWWRPYDDFFSKNDAGQVRFSDLTDRN